MYLDIHRHSSDKGLADKVLRNIFHNETETLKQIDMCSVGLHPWHVKGDCLDLDIKSVKEAALNTNVLAIGETGLDKAVKVDIEHQRRAFKNQIEIAERNNKPMVIHCVRAYDELQAYRKKANQKIPWIFHWFNASSQTAFDLIGKGCYLSFGHMLFKENSKALKAFKEIPLERIFLETDDANVTIQDVYHQAATLKQIDVDELKAQINKNFEQCFRRAL